MADLDVTKKLHLYHLLYRLNLSFAAIVRRCREFQQTRLFSSKSLTMYQGLAQELQADINFELLENIEQIEMDDWARFGKVSAAREKELRDPDDVFIAAEERRRELKKSGEPRHARTGRVVRRSGDPSAKKPLSAPSQTRGRRNQGGRP
jgi:biopolymer transport protein ExbB/TolQ